MLRLGLLAAMAGLSLSMTLHEGNDGAPLPSFPPSDCQVYTYADSTVLYQRADGGWAVRVLDGGYEVHVPIAKPPAQLANLADAGWVYETPLPDGGLLHYPARAPAGY